MTDPNMPYPAPPPPPPAVTTKVKKPLTRGGKITLGVFALIIVIVVASVANGDKKTSATSASAGTKAPGDTTAPSTATPAPTPAPTDTPAPQPVVLLHVSGNGAKTTKDFTTTTNEWTLAYTYDCASFGGQGNFAVALQDSTGSPIDQPLNELGAKGADSTVEHQDPGTYNLSVNSECKWSITVTG